MIELGEVIHQLRLELDRVRKTAEGEDLRFELGPIELEVTVALEVLGGAEVKVRFWVVEVGGDASAASTSTQRIKLTLQPSVTDGSTPADHSLGASAYVSGDQVAGER